MKPKAYTPFTPLAFAPQSVAGGSLFLKYEKLTMKDRVNKRNIKEEAPLTSKEKEILLMVASGSLDSEIADELCISSDEVETHLSNALRKIEAPNRLQAALWTVKNL